MDTKTLPEPSPEDVAGWERALYAFLAEKERRSGSRRTVEGYARSARPLLGVKRSRTSKR